ncbi:MAG: ABC transporter permease [Eubacteriales bacterium]|nr:ABC transporter permease [Eubacteriales bacterium]MDY2602460.1 ABC transporter permease [Eubacteriales bacterium]
MVKKALKWTYLMLILFFLYAPIVVMIALSFNASRSSAVWTGFTFDWYKDLLGDAKIMDALKVTLSVAVIATAVSTVLGTLAAIGIHGMKKGWAGWILNVSYLPMTMPDIVTGVSIMMLFVVLKMERGYWTMVMAHIAFDTPYVLFSVLPKLKQMDPNMYEAALDLGCKPFKALTKVIVPQVTPGIVTGGLLAFTMSIDDFIISYFTGGSAVNNLSIAVYGSARRGVSPSMYALSAVMFVVILVLLLIINRRSSLENV